MYTTARYCRVYLLPFVGGEQIFSTFSGRISSEVHTEAGERAAADASHIKCPA